MTTGLELCCGTLVVGLTALAGRPVDALTGFLGSKRRWAPELAAVAYGHLDDLIAVDDGPWGDLWTTLATPGQAAAVEGLLTAMDRRGTLPDLWPVLAEVPPPDDPVERAAQFLCLQARSASCIPVWWDPERWLWVAPTGARTASTPRTEASGRHGGRRRGPCQVDAVAECHGSRKLGNANPRVRLSSGLIRIATLAERVAAVRRLQVLDRITVIHGPVEGVDPIPGSRVLFDPPYVGCPRYAALCPRPVVLATATRHGAVAERVTVCEAVPLPLEGFAAYRLARREWITTRGTGAPRAQLTLWETP